MTSKKKKYREISRQQAEDLYKLGIEFQYRTKAGKGNMWMYPYMCYRRASGNVAPTLRIVSHKTCYPSNLMQFEAEKKVFYSQYNDWNCLLTVIMPLLFEDSMQHHDEIADVLKLKFYYRTEVE